jgi:UDP-2-acetamido-3-amino-2,3-dideoxy-glucuronate N-acetyltransferase
VSWLHPYKEQRLVIVGEKKMAVFSDTADDKLVVYPHTVEWINRQPVPQKAEGEAVKYGDWEPLRRECEHFLECMESRDTPRSNGREGLRVLEVLLASDRSAAAGGKAVQLKEAPERDYFVHESAYADEGAEIGAGTKVWHFGHVMKGAKIGKGCIFGQNVNVDGGTVIGNNVKVQNNVSIYTGTVVEDDVFLGPSCVLTNVTNPRSQVNRHSLYEKTTFKRGCSVGANATIVCGVTIGRYAFVGAGAVVTKNVPDYAMMVGVPARRRCWVSRHGVPLPEPDGEGVMVCPESGLKYKEVEPGVVRCLDLDEEEPLPEAMRKGTKPYDAFKTAE